MPPLRIVAADDDPDTIQFYEEALARLGHHVAVAENGRRLVEVCRSERPDLVITDIQMPEMDGIEAVKQVCQEKPVPVVFVSGHPSADLPERAPACPVVGVLRKPVSHADLERAIALGLRHLQGGK